MNFLTKLITKPKPSEQSLVMDEGLKSRDKGNLKEDECRLLYFVCAVRYSMLIAIAKRRFTRAVRYDM